MMNYNKQVLVSISCITYNHAQFIRRCLDSFLMQKTNFAFEVLIHDDCSTDGTTEIIKEYEAKYPNIIKPIYENENQYAQGKPIGSDVWNYPRAQGKYIAFCEGDDYWTDMFKLQKQVDFLENNQDYSMCFHRAKIVGDLSVKTDLDISKIGNRDYSGQELFDNWIVPTASILARTEYVLQKVKDKQLVVNGDIIIVLSCASKGKIRGFADIMSAYRIHAGGITYSSEQRKGRIMRMPEHFVCIKENFSFLEKKKIDARIAFCYWRRAKIQILLINKIADILNACKYSPVKCLKLFIKDLFCLSYYNI